MIGDGVEDKRDRQDYLGSVCGWAHLQSAINICKKYFTVLADLKLIIPGGVSFTLAE
jgi:hypothetical protein